MKRILEIIGLTIILFSLSITIDEYGSTYPPYTDPLFHLIALFIGGAILKVADTLERKNSTH